MLLVIMIKEQNCDVLWKQSTLHVKLHNHFLYTNDNLFIVDVHKVDLQY